MRVSSKQNGLELPYAIETKGAKPTSYIRPDACVQQNDGQFADAQSMPLERMPGITK